jgi:hypothetical protein
METSNIIEIWKQHENLLENTRKLNITLLKEVKLEKVRSRLKNLLFLPVSTLIFYTIVASYGLYFTLMQSGTWYFAFSGAVVSLFSVLYIMASIRQLKHILSVDYNAPVLILQKDISRIKSVVVTNLRIAVWLLPFGPFVGLFIIKALFNFDITTIIDLNMITSFGIVTILLEIAALLIARYLKPQNSNKKRVNWLLQGNGSQVDEALGFLNQIREFENKTN